MNPIKLVVSLLAWLTTTFSIAATFTVTNINDSGPGSFRQAIIDANTNAGTDNINFNIPGTAPFTITLWSALPAITEAVIISGNTQPGWSEGNPVIELNGANAGVGVNGLVIALASGSCTIRGLSIINFSGNGIYSENASGNTIRGNLIGITTNGNAAGNGGNGIYIAAGCNNNIIGGPANADRNIISSNLNGVDINNSSNNRVENNYIGTGKTGNEARGNRNHGLILGNNSNDNQVINNVISANGTVLVPSPASAYDADGNGLNIDLNSLRNIVRGNKIGLGADGTTLLGNKENGVIVVNGSHDNIIGGNGAGYRNYIAGSGNHAIVVYQSNNTDVKNNYIGTDVSGTLNKGNNDSGIIIISSSGTLVGGPNAGDENMFVFSREEQGVRIQQSQNTIVQRNLIGTNASGTANMGNFGGGVYILGEAGGSTGNVIGSDVAGRGNKIAYNGGNGITMFDGNTYDNPIRRNSIYCNALRGIELNGASNEYATFPAPVILPTSTNTMIRGTARAGAIIEVYGTGAECATCSGNPGSKTVQGKNYLGTVTADASGNWSFPFSGNPDTITATASEALSVGTAHSTSEFSACIVCVAPTPAISGPSFICSNSSNVKFYVTTQHPSSTYTWTVTGATSFTTNNDTVYVNVGSNGTVNVQVTEYNSGCSGSANASATIRPTPSVSVSASSTAICPDASTTLTANASGGNGAFTYEWFHNGNPIANSNSDEYTTSTAGTYTVRVTSNGCSVTSAATVINVKNAISVGVNGPSSSLCSGTSTTLTANASGGNGAFTYEWFHNGNPIANSNSDEYTTSTAGSYTVRVTSDGCSATSSVVVVSIKDAISVGVNGPSSSLCSGTSTTLTANASGGNGSYTYEWFHNGNPIANSNSDEYTTSTAGSYTVRVTSDGCSITSLPTDIIVNPVPAPAISGILEHCANTNNVVFSTTIDNSGSGSLYTWSATGGVSIVGHSGNQVTVNIGNTGGVLTVSETRLGCTGTAGETITIKQADFTIQGPSDFCAGDSAIFKINAVNTGTYSWTVNGATYTAFGDDSIRVFYGLTSPITISATETGLGCNTSNVKVINAAATATINPASNSYCQGESVTLTASTNPIVAGTTYQWYHNGQLISSSGSTYQASQAGTYYVVAVIPGVCTVKSGDEVITESPKPSAVVAVDQPVHCAGDQATVSITSSNDVATTYTWYKDGALLNGTTGSSFTTTQSGIYSVVATLGSCSDSSAAGAEVTFFSSSPDFTYSVTDCHSDFVQFTNLSTIPSGFENLVHYEWSFGDGNQSTDKAPGHQYDNSDVYTVTLRVTYLTCEDETSKQITFNGSPEVAIAVSSGNAIGCAGSPVTLVAQVQKGSGDFNYTWTPAAATSGSDQITVNPDSSVIYSVTVTDNITGCTISDNIQIERSKPVVEITGDNSLCTNSSLSLSAKVIGKPGIDYTYSYTTHPANAPLHVEASSSVAPVITSTAGGKYLLILTVTSNDALACTATQSLEITVHEPAVVTLSSSADTVCAGTEIVLAADISETSEWLWTAYDETMSEVYFTQSTSEQQLVTKTLAGTVVYQVLARDENGCLVEDTVKVHSVNNQNLVIPNLITPNEDELNDVLIIKDEHNLDILPGASLEIYNRWGHRVYLNNNYQNDWGGEGQSDGMYFFHLQPSCGDKEYKGWIQILGNTQSSGRVFNRN